jgi:hypothetical protein
MGGTIEWQALPIVAEMYGIADVEQLICDLVTIREFDKDQ